MDIVPSLQSPKLTPRAPFTKLWLCNPALGLASPERAFRQPEGNLGPRVGAHYWPLFNSFGPSSALGYCCQESRESFYSYVLAKPAAWSSTIPFQIYQ
jgi:hypothetical protein